MHIVMTTTSSNIIMLKPITCFSPHRRRPTSLSKPTHPLATNFLSSSSTYYKPVFENVQKQLSLQILDAGQIIKTASVRLLDAFVDSVFEFADHALLPSQSNFAPVDEVEGPVVITNIEGRIPDDFPQGVYIRNGPNPLFGGLKSTKSALFGESSQIWVEGEGMLHALYFRKDDRSETSKWSVVYDNRHVETDTYKIEKQLNKLCFLPAIEGDSASILSAFLLNWLRFGKVNKEISNTNVFEHGGKVYSIAENHMPHEIDIFTLETLGNWDVISAAWGRPFTSHPKKAPGTEELVVMGVNATKPFLEIGVISADGKKLVHRAELKLERGTLCHDIGVTKRYNVILDFPLTIDINRVVAGGPLIKYNKENYARIGVMPRYGDADSTQWFTVQPNCTFHIINCFEDEDDQVVVQACRALDSVIPGPKAGDEGSLPFFSYPYEWRLNMKTGEVRERYLTPQDDQLSMDFPMIHGSFTGLKNRYGYTQTLDSTATSISGKMKFGGIAKLHLEEHRQVNEEEKSMNIKVEHHMFEKNCFCSGSAFVPKEKGGDEEDDGWIISFVHNEDSNISYVYIVDAKKFSSEPVAKISLQHRVPYGFHGAFMPLPYKNYTQM